jgi:endonuclease/exonuclease/phosphatase family metal-dependent hydrolase
MPTNPAAPRFRRFTRGRISLFLLILLGLVIYDGTRCVPTPPAAGNAFLGPPASTQPYDTLRVATLNIGGGVGNDDRFDLSRTAGEITGYDLVGLQELHGPEMHVGGHAFKLPFGTDQAEELGGMLKLPYLFAPSETQWGHDAFGNGAVTDLPVLHWQRFPLSSAGSATNRSVLLLRLNFHGKPLNVIITHLDRHEDHNAELESVLELFESMEKPVIVLADLNSEPTDPQLNRLKTLADETGITLADKAGNLDWILARGMHAVQFGRTEPVASDHGKVWAELRLDD